MLIHPVEESFSAYSLVQEIENDPDGHHGRMESTWTSNAWDGIRREVIGLGGAWTPTDIFASQSTYLIKDEEGAVARERSAEDQTYDDLNEYFKDNHPSALQNFGPGSNSPDHAASQLISECTHPMHCKHNLKLYPNMLLPLLIIFEASRASRATGTSKPRM